MSDARELPRRVVIAGAGQVGVLAAIALKRALPSSEVMVLATPPDPGALADSAPTALPFTNRLHDRLGISEERLVREAGASHRLVVRYRGWGGAGHEGVAAYGATVDPRHKTGFTRDWGGGARNASSAPPPGSLGEVLAAEGRFAPPSGETGSPLADLDYAMRWSVPGYRDLLIGEAQRLGVTYRRGAAGAARPDGAGGIAALAVEGVGEIEADLFIDCTGRDAALHSQLPGADREDWRAALPVRGLLYGRPGEPLLNLEDRVSLLPFGWQAELASRDGRQAVVAMLDGTSEASAIGALGAEPGGVVALDQGRATEAWLGNVIALGDAAARFEPLGWLNLDLAHRQLALLLDLVPGRHPDPHERAEFNRRAALMADGVRDLLGAHYAAPGALPLGPVERSQQLERTLDQVARRGRMPFFEEVPLHVEEYSALLEALGFPRGQSPLALVTDPREGDAAGAAFAARAQAALASTPPYAAWLRHVLAS